MPTPSGAPSRAAMAELRSMRPPNCLTARKSMVPSSLRQALLRYSPQFVRMVTEKLMTYGARPRRRILRGAAGAAHLPRGPARRRRSSPARAAPRSSRPSTARSSTSSPPPSPTSSQQLHAAVRDAVPGWHGPAAPHRPRRPARDRHRGRGQAVGQERQEALAALGWRALAHRAGLPVRRVPRPARRPST